MANTYTLITSNTVGSGGVASVTFSSIPATYTDLLVKASWRDAQAQIYGGLFYYFNGLTTNRTNKYLEGNGASAVSGSAGSNTKMYVGSGDGASATANTFANGEIYIPNYAGSNNKSSSADGVGENNGTTAYANLNANLWSSTAAITDITFVGDTTLLQYSTFYLYGIKNS
jgi:hypothetical protein